jgi:hypothetical protein
MPELRGHDGYLPRSCHAAVSNGQISHSLQQRVRIGSVIRVGNERPVFDRRNPDERIVEAGDPVKLSPIRTDNAGQGFQGFWRPTA